MSEITIRRANRGDIDAIIKFNLSGAEETTGKSPTVDEIREGVSFVLRRHQDFYLVALRKDTEKEKEYVGQLKIHHHWYDWYDGLFWWVEHLYVKKECRQQGVASAMLNHIFTLAQENGFVKGILLNVNENNHSAIKAYKKNGFSLHDNRIMYCFEFPIMEIPLN